MNKTTPVYDDTIEKKLNAIICRLDENPVICIDPIESSAYMGITMANTEEGFLKYIKINLFDIFIGYIESYKKDCINAYAIKTHFIPLLKRLLVQYEEAESNLYESEIRNQWIQYFDESRILNAEQNLKKQAYQFFFKAAGVQIFFLGKLADKMKEYMAEFESAIPKPEPVYYFSILPEFTTQRHYILYDIHKNLVAAGYINCTPDAFKNVFTTKEPNPIYWFKSQRSLTYMIRILTGRFLMEKDKPSNYYITERYFRIIKKGVAFHPKRLRHDDNPNKKDQEYLDKVIDDAISAFI